MLAVWYPQPFFDAAGGSHLLFILVGVDVALGPTITLLIFDIRKKSLSALKFDVAIIATVQLAALLYGFYVVFQARPVYVVFVKDRFELATAADIDPDELAKVTRPEFRRLPLTGPRVVGALGPVDAKERERILFASILGGTDLHNFPQHYVPYEQVATEAAARGLTLAKAREVESNAAAAVAAYLVRSGRNEADVRYLPLRTRRTWLAAIVDAKSGTVIAFLPVKLETK
jgi:hypothetical protein